MRSALIIGWLILLQATRPAWATASSEGDSTRYTGFVVALAWPNAWAKEAGDSYDRLMRGLGFNDGGFYRVGHAALILVNAADSSCHYFDFGRYHAPQGMGRVRDAETDHELMLSTRAEMDDKRLTNLDALLCEVQSNRATHGSGPMYASYVRIDFAKAIAEAKRLQQLGVMAYGPFERDGLNCSRFVRQVILAGDPHWAHALRLEVVPMVTPTTLYPVSALYHWTHMPGCPDAETEAQRAQMSSLPDSVFREVLSLPKRPKNIPQDAQWLAGEASGSWFHVEMRNQVTALTRFSQKGEQECAVHMQQQSGEPWNGHSAFEVTYPSNCKELTLSIDGMSVRFGGVP